MPSAATGGRVLIASNIFTLNAGFFDSNVIFIRARGPTWGSIYSIVPSDGSVFCSGYRFDSNVFYQNFGCQGSAGGVIKLECVDSTQTSTAANDAYTYSTLGSVIGAEYYAINFAGYTTTYTSATTYNGVSYTVDRNRNDWYMNNYTENYQTYSSGLITILGAPRNFF